MKKIARTWVINGERRSVEVSPMRRLLDVLREDLNLKGTKEGCGEGECGACTVLLNGEPVTACLVAAGQIPDGAEIMTVEGLEMTEGGRVLQKAYIEHGAAQCGFCIPGMIVSSYAFLSKNLAVSERAIRDAHAGNICRCTGYAKIIEAVSAAAKDWPASGVTRDPQPVTGHRSQITHMHDLDNIDLLTPRTLAEALTLQADEHTRAIPLAGGTDLMVQWESGTRPARGRALDVKSLEELRGICRAGARMAIGASVTHAEIRRSPLVQRCVPALAAACATVGGVQIQTMGTIAGSVANASPAGDLAPALLTCDAAVVVASLRGDREIPVEQFWTGYRKTDLKPDELIVRFLLPVLPAGFREGFRKLGPRAAQAISKIMGSYRGCVVGGRVQSFAVALGSVAPTALRLRRLEAWLVGRPLDATTLAEAERRASDEVAPISDIRSTAGYRKWVSGRLARHFLEELAV
jgi:carbon-monoxide dehydrogenase small subunit/xanthine dehydrogenase small subunit